MGCLILLIIGCSGVTTRYQPDPGVPVLAPHEPAYEETIQLRYLGAGGYLIRRGKHAILTAPLYTNPGWLRVGLGWIAPDTALIDRLHPPTSTGEVGAILVGHAHYDHLLDVPYIARKYHPEAKIYGNRSMANLVVAAEPRLVDQVRVLEEEVARGGQPGKWFYLADSTIRFMAIESDHGPHFLGIHVMKGEAEAGLKGVPRSAWGWKEGETLAYLIDFLGPDKAINFRIHYQDATSHYPLGAPPDFAPPDSHRLDLAITCVDTWFQVPDYPEALIRNHRPRYVILGHWENFLRSPLKPPWTRFSSLRLRRFIPSVLDALPPDTDWIVPLPGALYRYRPAPR
ncbi:MAG: MBL fold metallo-hydrolase [Candidatus Marinimicrobia bacterium]|nr:MBL fold metallo-hydrolase [Candidatus Neomarinimicrobiota bacterium]